jgi:hypothetical protein
MKTSLSVEGPTVEDGPVEIVGVSRGSWTIVPHQPEPDPYAELLRLVDDPDLVALAPELTPADRARFLLSGIRQAARGGPKRVPHPGAVPIVEAARRFVETINRIKPPLETMKSLQDEPVDPASWSELAKLAKNEEPE